MTLADEAELEILQLGSAMRAFWWVTDVTEQFPWAKRHRLLWFVSRPDKRYAMLVALDQGMPPLILSGRNGLRAISTVLVDELGTIPGPLAPEELSKIVRWWMVASPGILLSPECLDERKAPPVPDWLNVASPAMEARFRGYCARLPAFLPGKNAGAWTLEFCALAQDGSVERWNVEGTAEAIRSADPVEVEPPETFRRPFF